MTAPRDPASHRGSNSYSKLVARYQRDLLALHAASESLAW
jgi:hypothetical protein